jgi:hypothetical protein
MSHLSVIHNRGVVGDLLGSGNMVPRVGEVLNRFGKDLSEVDGYRIAPLVIRLTLSKMDRTVGPG